MVNIKILTIALILINLIIPIYIVFKKCVFKKELEVNHVLLFTTGFIYYWTVPIVLGNIRYMYGTKTLKLWYLIYDAIPQSSLIIYLIVILLFYISFTLGSIMGERITLSNNIINKYSSFNKDILNKYLLVLTIPAGLFIYKFRFNLFKGYQGDLSIAFEQKGPFVALSLVILALAIIYTLKSEEEVELKPQFERMILNKHFAAYFFIAILILSLGGRLYFISSLLMLLVYKTVYYKKIQLKKFIGFGVGAIVLMGVLGIIREGSIHIRIDSILFHIFAEPLFTGFSLINFVKDGVFELINFPKFLISDFINLVPTHIFPNKGAYLLNPSQHGYKILNPLGAFSSYVSFIINFGIIGSCAAFFSIGLFLEALKKANSSLVYKGIYIMTSGWLVFTFFRDGFRTSVVKNIFQFSMLMPVLIVISAHFLSKALKRKEKELI